MLYLTGPVMDIKTDIQKEIDSYRRDRSAEKVDQDPCEQETNLVSD